MRKQVRLGRITRAVLLALLTLGTLGHYQVTNRLALRWMRDRIRDIPEREYRRTISRLAEQKLVTLKRNGAVDEISLLPAGRRRAIAAGLGVAMRKSKSAAVAGRVLLVSFDIPERVRERRALLRLGLKALGGSAIQQSLYELPNVDAADVRALATTLNIARYVRAYRAEPIR